MKGDSWSDADKGADRNAAGQDARMAFQAYKSQIVISGGAAWLKFHLVRLYDELDEILYSNFNYKKKWNKSRNNEKRTLFVNS